MDNGGPPRGETVLIVAGGDLRDPSFLKETADKSDLVIAADGGLRHLLAIDRLPDILIGDLDSLEPNMARICNEKGISILRHPPEKDDTDTELAMKAAFSRGAEKIILAGCTGDRLDHTLSNVCLLLQGLSHGVQAILVDSGQTAFFIRSRCEIQGREGDIVSLLPFTERVTGIYTEGLKYPLKGETLKWGHSRGVSNELVAAKASVRVASGILLVIHVTERQALNPA